jgi:AMMECR1 domain-containing protein
MSESEREHLILNLMYYALFHKVIDNYIFFPKNVFGIFSTIRRFTLDTYQNDIHGCIGYWDKNFKNLKNQSIYDNLLRVTYDSMWNDRRKQYFTPIQYDPYSFLEVDFMINPVYKININGKIDLLNIPYTNKEFGIIIQTKDKRATYLPNVFGEISWRKILISIKKKANINTDFELFAYKIIQIKARFIELIGKLFTYLSLFKFTRFLIDTMNPRLPFPFIHSYKNTLEWHKDDIRNIATLGAILKYITLYPNITKQNELQIIKKKVIHVIKNIDNYSSQSLSFIGYIYSLYNLTNNKFCKKLLNDLSFATDEFEKPEIIIGLNKAGCFTKKTLTYDSNDSIFKMNWTIQGMISFNEKPSLNMISILQDKIDEIILNIQKIETNYIAVAFESLCFLYKSNGIGLHKLFILLFELEKRKDILYMFLDNSARVDISIHVYNGLVELNRS